MQLPKDLFFEKNRNIEKDNKLEYLYILAEKTCIFFHKQIYKDIAQKYCDSRNIAKNIISEFMIGFCYISIINLPIIKKNLSINYFLYLGLIGSNNDQLFNKFNNRLIFPVRDIRGRTIGFIGRSISFMLKPKYLNSKNTVLFKKHLVLYGLFEFKQKKIDYNNIIVVEGLIDVLSLVKYNFLNVVAILGSAISIEQIKILFHETNIINFCLDGDVAGHNAAFNIIKIIFPYMYGDKKINFIFLPQEEDPDSFIHKYGASIFQKYINKAIGIGDFFLNVMKNNLYLKSIDDCAKFLDKINQYMNLIPKESLFRKTLEYKITELINMKYYNKIPNVTNNNRSNTDVYQNIYLIISILLQYPSLIIPKILIHENHLKYSLDANVMFLLKVTKFIKVNNYNNINDIMNNWDSKKELDLIAKCSMNLLLYDNIEHEFDYLFNQIIKKEKLLIIDKLLKKSKIILLSSNEKDKLARLLKEVKLI
jgi:DNA primase